MKMNILELHDKFCDEARFIRNFSPSTIGWYRSSLKGLLQFYGDKFDDLQDLTTDRIRDFLYHGRIERQWSPETFIYYHKGLKSFFRWCVDRGYQHMNPLSDIEKPKLEKKLPKSITKQEALRLLEYSFNARYAYRFERYRNQALFAVMIYSGLRASEVLNLKLNEVDLINRLLHVNHGKGGKDRVVPICGKLRRILDDYLNDRDRLGRMSVSFFTSTHGDVPYTYNGLKHLVARMKKSTRINFSCHRLRHTFATLMLEGGCDIYALSKMLGHSDIKTTTIYLSASVSHLQEQVMKHPLN